MVSRGFISIEPLQPTTCHENSRPSEDYCERGFLKKAEEAKVMKNGTYNHPPSTGQKLQVIIQVYVCQHLNNHIDPLVTNRFLHHERNEMKVGDCKIPSPVACFTECVSGGR